MHDFNVGDKVWDVVKARKGVVTELDCDVNDTRRGLGTKSHNRHYVDWKGGEDDGEWDQHEDRDLVPYSNASSPDEVAIDEAGGSEKPEAVVHPNHYGGDTTYEVIKVIEAWGLGFALGNTVKYVARAGKKDKAKELEDLRKAAFYLNREISRLEADNA